MWQESNKSAHRHNTHTHTSPCCDLVPAVAASFDGAVSLSQSKVRRIFLFFVHQQGNTTVAKNYNIKCKLNGDSHANVPVITRTEIIIGGQGKRSEGASNCSCWWHGVKVSPSCSRIWSWGGCWRLWPPWLRRNVTGGNIAGVLVCADTLKKGDIIDYYTSITGTSKYLLRLRADLQLQRGSS